MDKVTRQCPQTTTFSERKESRSGIKPRSFRLQPNALPLGQTGSPRYSHGPIYPYIVLGPVLFVLYATPLSDIIANHSVNHQLFADNQLQKSTRPPNDVQSLTHDLQPCTDDIKAWMCNNQLKLNEDKTKAIL